MPKVVKKNLTEDSRTYCYWTLRGLAPFKREFIENPFVTDLDIIKQGALSIISSAVDTEAKARFSSEIKAAKSKEDLVELFKRANINGQDYCEIK